MADAALFFNQDLQPSTASVWSINNYIVSVDNVETVTMVDDVDKDGDNAISLLEATKTTMVDDDLSQGGAAAPDAKVARRKMTGLSNKVRPYHHGHSPSPHRHLHCPCCLLHGYIIRYSKSWLWTFMTRWIGGKQTPSGTRLRYLKNSYWCHQLR